MSGSTTLRFTIRHILEQVHNQPEHLIFKKQQQQQKQIQNNQQKHHNNQFKLIT